MEHRKIEDRIENKEQVLANWNKLNETVMFLTEAEVVELMEYERCNKGRLRVLLRLYNRYSKLRGQREKKELAKDAKA